MEGLFALSYTSMFLITLSHSGAIDCDYHCQDGSTVNSTDCYVVVSCDLLFPNISFSYKYKYKLLRLNLNFTELVTDDAVPPAPFLYSGTFRLYEDHTYDRYLFQVEYLLWNLSGDFYEFSFRIRDIQPGDAGTYHVSLLGTDYYDGTVGPILIQHTYRLFDIHFRNSFGDFYEFSFRIRDSEPGDAGIYQVNLTEIDVDAGPVLLQHTYRIFVYQPPTPLVCEGPSSFPSASYHVGLSCSITDGYPPINLEVIKPEGCDYQKHFTDNNGTKELLVYVNITSCDQNSTIGCIANQEPLESFSISPYSARCEFNISKPDQDESTTRSSFSSEESTGTLSEVRSSSSEESTRTLSVVRSSSSDESTTRSSFPSEESTRTLSVVRSSSSGVAHFLPWVSPIVAVLCILSFYGYKVIFKPTMSANVSINTDSNLSGPTQIQLNNLSLTDQSLLQNSLQGSFKRKQRSDLPSIPSDDSTGCSESNYYSATTTDTAEKSRIFSENDFCLLSSIKMGTIYNRWMGTIDANKVAVLTTIPEELIKKEIIHWHEFVKRTLDLPKSDHLINIEGIGVKKITYYLITGHVDSDTLASRLTFDPNSMGTQSPMLVPDVMKHISGILEGMEVIKSYGVSQLH
ncbi:uncharacterized protein [Apostichopus japonicus]|uniref:uncharacterized protein n=1 Tax=Stichopus japonicus TaxID=307972 RepID=UPI003AB2FE58